MAYFLAFIVGMPILWFMVFVGIGFAFKFAHWFGKKFGV